MSRRAAAAGLTAEASSTSVPVVSMIRRTTSSSGSPTWARSIRSSAASRAKRSSASGEYGASPGSASASSSAGISAGSIPSAIASRCSVTWAGAAPRPRVAGELGGPLAEQLEVARPDRPARAVEEGEQRGVRGDVVQQPQHRHDLGDLGQPQQAREADDLDRDAGAGEGVEDVGGVGVVAGQHADRRPRPVVGVAHGVGQPGQLVGVPLEDAGGHLARGGAGLGLERLDLTVRGEQRLGEAVGDVEDARVRAAVDGQRQHRHLAGPEAAGKVSAKLRMLETEAPRQP